MFKKANQIKILAITLTIIITATLALTATIPAAFAADPPTNPNGTTYQDLVERLLYMRDSLREGAADYGEVEIAPGYSLDLKTEMEIFANNIDFDLAVADAIANGRWNDTTLLASMAGQSNRNYNQNNFNTAMGNNANARENSARTYLMQGGIGSTATVVNWSFGFGSKLNPDYRHSHSYVLTVTSISQANRLNNTTYPGGVASFAENYAVTLLDALETLITEVNKLKALSDLDSLKAEMCESECLVVGCEDEECDDWTHRLMISQAQWENAANEFVNKINRDLIIVGDLATGRIDSGFWNENRNGYNYYNNTVANSTISKINSALAFLEDGGVSWGIAGGAFYGTPNTWLYYRSVFTEYKSEHNTGLSSGSFSIDGQDEVISLVEFHRDVLVLGATPGQLEMIYNIRVNQIQALINQAKALRGTSVPVSGNMTQQEYNDAIEKYIADAECDLTIAAALVNDNLVGIRSLADHWLPKAEDEITVLGYRLGVDYLYSNRVNLILFSFGGYGDNQDKRYANAINYFKNGGYEYGFTIPKFTIPFTTVSVPEIGVEVRFKSAFHPEYSGGFLNIATNKENIIPIMENALEDLKAGNTYISPLNKAKERYEAARAKLQEIADSPGSVITSNLSSNEEMDQLVTEIEFIFANLADIQELIEAVMTLVGLVGEDMADSLLQNLGMSLEQVYGYIDVFNSTIETLEKMGFDPTGEETVRESLEKLINAGIEDVVWLDTSLNWVFDAINTALDLVEITFVIGKTESTYNLAAGILETAYDEIMSNPTISGLIGSLLGMVDLDPILGVLDVMRPILTEIKSVVDMVNAVLKMVYDIQDLIEEINQLMEEFNFYGLSQALDKLADIVEDLSKLIDALERSQLGMWALEMLSGQLGSDGLSGVISGGLAGLLNDLVNGWIGSEFLNLSGDQISFIGDFANGLITDFLNNPGAVVKYLDLAETIIRSAAGVSLGVSYILAEDALARAGLLTPDLMQNYGNYVFGATTIINSVYSGFTGADLLDEECIQHIVDIVACVNKVIVWAQEIMAIDDSLNFAQNLTIYFAGRIVNCLVESDEFQMAMRLKDLATEAYDIASFLLIDKGQFIITAQEDAARNISLWGHELIEWYVPEAADDFYYEYNSYPNSIYFTSNSDALLNKVVEQFKKMGILFGYQINHQSDPAFYLASNYLEAGNLAGDSAYDIKVSYRMYLDLTAGINQLFGNSGLGNYPIPPLSLATLATKSITVVLGDITCPHNYKAALTAPTCTEQGYTTYTCQDCKDSYTDNFVEALKHDYLRETVEARCLGSGSITDTCKVCRHIGYFEEIPAQAHSYQSNAVTEPTCETDGFTLYTCVYCGDSYKDDIYALEHDWDEGVVTSEATTQAEGVKTYNCQRCTATMTENIPMLIVTEPTLIIGAVLYQASIVPATISIYSSEIETSAFAEFIETPESNDTAQPIASAITKPDCTFSLILPAADPNTASINSGSSYILVITKPGYLSYTITDITDHNLSEALDIGAIDLRHMAGDVTGDGYVNAEDLTLLLSEFNKKPAKYDTADIDGSGIVNAVDLTYLLAGFNKRSVEISFAELYGLNQ